MVVNAAMEGIMELPEMTKSLTEGTLGPILDLSYRKFAIQSDFDVICNAIGSCPTLYCLEMAQMRLPVEYATSLARALSSTRSIQVQLT